MKNIKRLSQLVSLLVVAAVVAVGCNLNGSGSGTGTMNLSITDAPIDASDVVGVWITIQSVEYHRNGRWSTMEGFGDPQKFNLLNLTGGDAALVGALQLPAGQYTQIRFMLDVADEGEALPSNPGSYVEYSDESGKNDVLLFVPSGGETGYKAGADEPFSVPEGGEISITADFDLRRAVVATGGTGMILKPVLRLVVEDQAGEIAGTVAYAGADTPIVIAYEAGTYADTESTSGDNGFDNAVTSSNVAENGSYTLAFLPAGTYDIVVAEFNGNGEYVPETAAIEQSDVEVRSGETSSVDLTVE